MRSINLIPPKHPDRPIRTWLALMLIVALAAGALAGIYYYTESIHTEAERYLAEAREVERQTAEFMEQAVPRVSSERLNEFGSRVEEAAAARVGWETHLLEVVGPLPQTAVVHSIHAEESGAIVIAADFKTYAEALGFIHRLEQLPRTTQISVSSFAESSIETTESVPVANEEGAILYYETKAARQDVYNVNLRIALTEGDAVDDRQGSLVE